MSKEDSFLLAMKSSRRAKTETGLVVVETDRQVDEIP
jgi:hypothetical protein